MPAERDRSKIQSLNWIKESVHSNMDRCKEKLLNLAGKEVLIKDEIQAIPSYVMSIVNLPRSFCTQLCAMVAKFWWKSEGKTRGIH